MDYEIRKCAGDGWNVYFLMHDHPMFAGHFKTEADANAFAGKRRHA